MRHLLTSIGVALVLGAGMPVRAQAPAETSGASKEASAIPRGEVPVSLMFTIDEMNEIQSRIAAGSQAGGDREGNADSIENATLYLSTILYFSPENWTIWINGRPIGPRQDFQEFEVTAIDASSVELVVPLSAQGMRPVRLAPNQTLVVKTGDVVEGPWK